MLGTCVVLQMVFCCRGLFFFSQFRFSNFQKVGLPNGNCAIAELLVGGGDGGGVVNRCRKQALVKAVRLLAFVVRMRGICRDNLRLVRALMSCAWCMMCVCGV